MYGIDLYNTLGEKLLDDFPTVYNVKTGTTVTVDSFLANAKTSIGATNAEFIHNELSKMPLRTYVASEESAYTQRVWYHTIADTYSHFTKPNGTVVVAPSPLYPTSSLFFYEVDTSNGLCLSWNNNLDFPEFSNKGVFPLIGYTKSAGINYKIGEINKVYSGSENYGIQYRNSSGQVTTDTRNTLLKIVDFFYISKNDIWGICNENIGVPGQGYARGYIDPASPISYNGSYEGFVESAKIILPLRRPVTNPYIATSYHASVEHFSLGGASSTTGRAVVRKHSNTSISITGHGTRHNTPYSTVDRGANQDLIIIVAE